MNFVIYQQNSKFYKIFYYKKYSLNKYLKTQFNQIFCQNKISAGFVWISNYVVNQAAIWCPLLQVTYDAIKAMNFKNFVQKLYISFSNDIMKYVNGQKKAKF